MVKAEKSRSAGGSKRCVETSVELKLILMSLLIGAIQLLSLTGKAQSDKARD
jgi:hypothetical protein